jgi:hypothetical protein
MSLEGSGFTEEGLHWDRFSLVEQMANIGSEVERALRARASQAAGDSEGAGGVLPHCPGS